MQLVEGEQVLQREEIPLIEDREVLQTMMNLNQVFWLLNAHLCYFYDTHFYYVKIKWPSKGRSHITDTPWRRKCIKQLTRKNFRSFSTTVMSSSTKSNTKRIILVGFIASILLKKRLGKMALLQQAVSVLLYGNGCTEQVC